jgi:hypothetical protein
VLLDDGSPESDRYSLSADASCLGRLSSIAKCLSLRCSDRPNVCNSARLSSDRRRALLRRRTRSAATQIVN